MIKDANIFIISHKTGLHDSFENVIKFDKVRDLVNWCSDMNLDYKICNILTKKEVYAIRKILDRSRNWKDGLETTKGFNKKLKIMKRIIPKKYKK